MKLHHRLLAAIAVLALAVAPGVAIAKKPAKKGHKPSPRAKVMRAILEPTTTDAEYAGIRGKAHLVDNKKRDKATVHVRNLRPGATYLWHVHEADGDENPCDAGSAGPIVDDFEFKPKKANEAGNLNAKARSRTFKTDPEETYYVNVHLEDGTVIACGVLKARKRGGGKAKGHAKRKAGKRQSSRGKAPSTRRGAAQGKGPSRDSGPARGKGRRP